MHDQTRLRAAIERTFAEAEKALLKLTAYNALCEADVSYGRMSFFAVAQDALSNDMVANAVRVLDEHRDVAAFWYIHRCHPLVVERALLDVDTTLESLRDVSKKLRHIREKTLFHIDRDAVQAPQDVWSTAALKADEFKDALSAVAHSVSAVHRAVFSGDALVITEYDGSDVSLIVKAFENIHGPVHGVR